LLAGPHTCLERRRPKIHGRPCCLLVQDTTETSWSIPEEIRYYLSDAGLEQILSCCSIALMKEWEAQFSIQDLDGSGTIDEEEIALFLRSVGEQAEPKKVSIAEEYIRTMHEGLMVVLCV
jgi:hypothetical protein